jgi:hypothetical protein
MIAELLPGSHHIGEAVIFHISAGDYFVPNRK